MKPPFLRAFGNYDVDKASDEAGLKCVDKSLAQQSFAEECDINTIIKRFGLDGKLPENVRMPTFGDFVGVPDFQTAMNIVVAARESFDQMPARVRARFHHDPAEFVAFCSKDENAEEAAKLGLVKDEVVAARAAAAASKAAEEARLIELGRKAELEAETPPKGRRGPGTGST